MKSIRIFSILFMFSFCAFSLNVSAQEEYKIFVSPPSPEYPGGYKSMMIFISENLKYPQQAIEAKVEGIVHTTFFVEEDGSLTDIKILRGIGYGCDEEVIRVISLMPKWEPAKNREKAFRQEFNLPIRFKINGIKKSKKNNKKK